MTYKNDFNKKYGFKKDEPHTLKEISKITGYQMKGIQTIFDKGIGAFKTNPGSVRKNVVSRAKELGYTPSSRTASKAITYSPPFVAFNAIRDTLAGTVNSVFGLVNKNGLG